MNNFNKISLDSIHFLIQGFTSNKWKYSRVNTNIDISTKCNTND